MSIARTAFLVRCSSEAMRRAMDSRTLNVNESMTLSPCDIWCVFVIDGQVLLLMLRQIIPLQ
jgi:hypothetical protein